jgi:hypothetical protein
MNLQYLLDEHVDALYRTQLLRRLPSLIVWCIGDPNAPPKGTLDPDILIWCETHNFVLVTNNRASMPVHLADHLAAGKHSPGILQLNPHLSIGETIEALEIVAQTTLDEEFRDRINFLAKL